MSKNKTGVPSNIVDMMRARGYAGSGNVGYYEAMKWLSEKYGAWLVANPRYLTPIDSNYDYYDPPCENKILMWEIEARDLSSWLVGDYYCNYFAIHQYYNPTEQALEDADVYGVEVCEDGGKFYKSYEDAICAGLIRTMFWIEKGGYND